MLLSTFLDNTELRNKFNELGIYVVSVNIPQYRNLYKVGMADKGGLNNRISNFQTFFFPIRDKVIIHLLANKPRGKRVKKVKKKNGTEVSVTNGDTVPAVRIAESALHRSLKSSGWTNDKTGEWFRQPTGKTIKDIINLAMDHHFGNKSKNIKADGGMCNFCIMDKNVYEKVPRPKISEGQEPEQIVLEPIIKGIRKLTVRKDGKKHPSIEKMKEQRELPN